MFIRPIRRNPILTFDPRVFGLLYATPDWILTMPRTPSLQTASFPIPDANALIGREFFQQVLVVDSCYGQAFLSRGGHGVIGT